MKSHWVHVGVVAFLVGGMELGLSSQAIADVIDSVTLVSPALGSALNPNLPFTITLDLVGGSASTAENCDDGQLSNFQFGAEEIDSNDVGQPLGWTNFNGVGIESTGGNLDSYSPAIWSAKIIPNGIECSLLVGPGKNDPGYGSWSYGEYSNLDNQWFQTNQGTLGTPTKVDIAWTLDSAVIHHLFKVTSAGSPSISITGLERGQTVNYVADFKVSATQGATLPLNPEPFSVDITPPNTIGGDSESFVDCSGVSPNSDSNNNYPQPIRTLNKDGSATYTLNCHLYLPGGNEFITDPVIQLSAVFNSGTPVTSPVISLNVGKQGSPVIQMAGQNTKTGQYGTLTGTNPKKPWLAPAILTLHGFTCIDPNAADCLSANSEILPNQRLSLCIAPLKSDLSPGIASCSPIITDFDGVFTTAKKITLISLFGIQWSIDGTYLGIPFKDSDGVQAAGSTGRLQLPAQPQIPLTSAQMKKNKLAAYYSGIQLMRSFGPNDLFKLNFDDFFSPGRSMLTQAQARDFCAQLNTVIPDVAILGLISNSNFVDGCASAAIKIPRQ